MAAGSSSRMGGGVPKQFRSLGDIPLYQWATLALLQWGGVTLVVPPDTTPPLQSPPPPLGPVRMVPGGRRRRDSVALGLAAVPPQARIVLVHDAARPFVPSSMLRRVLEASASAEVVVPALYVVDTVKRSEGSTVRGTIDRSNLLLSQTPQACRRDVLAAIASLDPTLELTDEAHGAELLGITPRWVEGSPFAFKITTEADFAFAQAVAEWIVTKGSHHEDWLWIRRASTP